MSDFPESLLVRSFCAGAGPEYNQTSWDLREERGNRLAAIYEVVLDPEPDWERLTETFYPSFVRFLQSKRVPVDAASAVVVTIFHGDRFHCLEGPELLRYYREREGLDTAGFAARVERWRL